MSLHLVDQRVINFHTFCVIISLNQKNPSKYISKRKFQRVKRTFWVRFRRDFNVSRWNLERTSPGERCPILRQKTFIGEFLVFASFKSYDYFSEEDACFINSQSLTAFSRERCQKDIKSDRKRTWLVNLCTLRNSALCSEYLKFVYVNDILS